MTPFRPATAGVLAILLTACAGGPALSPAESGRESSRPSATTLPSALEARPSAATPRPSLMTAPPTVGPTPITVDLRPAFRVPIAGDGDINRVAVVGDEVWVPAGRSIVRVDMETRETTTIASPVSAPAADSFGATADAVWIGDFDRGKVYRLDRRTGAVLSDLIVARPVTFAEAHGTIWVGSGASKTMVAIDLAGSKATVTNLPHELVAGDSAWGALGFGAVRRIVIDSGDATAIAVARPAGPGDCSVKGTFESLWLLCHENDTAARIDPATNSVMTTVEVGSPVFGGVQVVEGRAFFIEGRDEAGLHEGRIVRVDLTTNQVDRIFDLGPEFDPNPAVVADGVLWVPVAASGELWGLLLSGLLVE